MYGGYYYPYAATYGYQDFANRHCLHGYGATAYGPPEEQYSGNLSQPEHRTYAPAGRWHTSAYGSRGVAAKLQPYTGATVRHWLVEI